VRLYDSLTRTELDVEARSEPIGMYVCGPTVYDRVHVGNARPYVLGIWLKRWLESKGHDVKLVANITDVDDNVYEAAASQGIPSRELAARATDWYREDTNDLGLGRPDVEPLASETIAEIIALVEELIEKGMAYEAGGDVYFRVASFPEYGRLSGAKLDEVIAQEPSELKEDQRDFALWKAQKPGEDYAWESPWGMGRPGWHIECSAMAEKFLGPEFEIHGGGSDLRFPHHENELAQSRGAGRPFARVWVHNGMLQLAGEKMAKSVGNVRTLRHAIDTWGREALLLYFLTGQWRKPIDFTRDVMEAAQARAEGFRDVFRNPHEPAPPGAWERFEAALDDDFNTPNALAVMHEWRDHDLLRRALSIFGLESLAEEEEAPAEIVDLAARRQVARESRDFEEADRLREELEAAGWEARDEPGGYRLVPRR
jgi:cysteinyl-tRNA synthetase